MDRETEPAPTPLNEPAFFILLSLAAGPKHGYAMLKDIEALSGGKIRLSTSTLYTALARLQEQGLIERSDVGENDRGPGLPRKVYRLTEEGRRALNAEAQRMQAMLASFELRLGEQRP